LYLFIGPSRTRGAGPRGAPPTRCAASLAERFHRTAARRPGTAGVRAPGRRKTPGQKPRENRPGSAATPPGLDVERVGYPPPQIHTVLRSGGGS
jgi:hypothetical protein